MKTNIFGPYSEETIHPGFSIDCVILSFHKKKLKVLLYKMDFDDFWALPGGFMFKEEDAQQAAYRILGIRTGLTNIFLKQFHLFSDPKRTIMEQNIDIVNRNTTTEEEGKWFLQRFLSLGFYALVKYDEVKLAEREDERCEWYEFENLPNLYSDHKNIISTALDTIRTMLPVIPIGQELLPEKFTMTELRTIYEIILGKSLDRRNFQRKALSEGRVIQLEEKQDSKTYNPTILYSFNPNRKIDSY